MEIITSKLVLFPACGGSPGVLRLQFQCTRCEATVCSLTAHPRWQSAKKKKKGNFFPNSLNLVSWERERMGNRFLWDRNLLCKHVPQSLKSMWSIRPWQVFKLKPPQGMTISSRRRVSNSLFGVQWLLWHRV